MLLVACLADAQAQHVVQAVSFEAQPLQYMKDGRVSGCGLRFIAGRDLSANRVEFSEVSINFHAGGRTLVKGVAYAPVNVNRPEARPVKVASAWVRAAGHASTHPVSSVAAGDDKLSLLFHADFDAAIAVVEAQRVGKPIQMSVRRATDKGETILVGTPLLDKAEAAQMLECFSSLSSVRQPAGK